jgi:uncharacterized cupin superfamily protein
MADIGRAVGSQTIGLTVQTVAPGCRASRRHQHVFREEILTVMVGAGTLLQGDARLPVGPGDCFCCTPQGEELHTFENTGTDDQVIWAFGNRFRHEVCLYPDEGVAFVEGLGAEIPLATAVDSPGRRSDGSGERIPSTIGVPPPVCAPSRYDGGYELGKPHHWPAIGKKTRRHREAALMRPQSASASAPRPEKRESRAPGPPLLPLLAASRVSLRQCQVPRRWSSFPSTASTRRPARPPRASAPTPAPRRWRWRSSAVASGEGSAWRC